MSITYLIGIQVNKPYIIRHFKIQFVKEETCWNTNDVRCRGQKQLKDRDMVIRTSSAFDITIFLPTFFFFLNSYSMFTAGETTHKALIRKSLMSYNRKNQKPSCSKSFNSHLEQFVIFSEIYFYIELHRSNEKTQQN